MQSLKLLFVFSFFSLSLSALNNQNFPFRNEKLLVEQRIFDLVSSIEIPITNRSKISAGEVMQLYVQIEKAPFRVPLYDLKNFQRLSFNAIETKTATARIPVSELASINEKGEKVLLKGNYKLFWGTSLPTERSKALGAGNWKEITITLK